MANTERHRITGLFINSKGIMSANVKKQDVIDAMAKVEGDEVQVTVWPAEKKHERSPSHSMTVGAAYHKDDSRSPDPLF